MVSLMMQWNEVDDNSILLWPSQTVSLLFYYIWALLIRGIEKLGGIIRIGNESGNGFKLCHSRHIRVNGEDMRVNRSRRVIFVVIWETWGKKWHSTFFFSFFLWLWSLIQSNSAKRKVNWFWLNINVYQLCLPKGGMVSSTLPQASR